MASGKKVQPSKEVCSSSGSYGKLGGSILIEAGEASGNEYGNLGDVIPITDSLPFPFDDDLTSPSVQAGKDKDSGASPAAAAPPPPTTHIPPKKQGGGQQYGEGTEGPTMTYI